MKKYIIWAVVVLVALTSCEVDGGTRRDEAQRLMANKVCESIRVPISFAKYLVYADLMLRDKNSEAEKMWQNEYSRVELSSEGDIVELKIIVNSVHSESFFINTMGRTLYEGGVWSLSHKKDDKVTELLTYAGVEGKERCMTFNGEFDLSEREKVKHQIEIKYRNKNTNHWSSTYDIVVNGTGSVTEAGQYSLDFEIEEHDPLNFYANTYIYKGSLFIKYRDIVENKSRDVVFVYGFNR